MMTEVWELENLILNLQNEDKINYENVRAAGEGILNGSLIYSRLHNDEEQGTIAAGRVAVESPIIAENHKRNNPEKYCTSPKNWAEHKKNVATFGRILCKV